MPADPDTDHRVTSPFDRNNLDCRHQAKAEHEPVQPEHDGTAVHRAASLPRKRPNRTAWIGHYGDDKTDWPMAGRGKRAMSVAILVVETLRLAVFQLRPCGWPHGADGLRCQMICDR